jgi:DNA topoisomerase-1
MSKILIIVESPAKCKKIESFLGSQYKCIASFGHIRELMTQKGLQCIEIENNYNPLFQISQRQKKQVATLKKNIQESKEILLATDDDREGEAIAWHICQVCKLNVNTTKRIIFHEITKPALIKAVKNPGKINMDMVNSQKARQVLDLLVGFTISPILWKSISSNKKSALSAGRCQTPALRLVYDNELDIQANPGKKCYAISGYFTKNNIKYVLDKDIETKDECEEFLENSVNHSHMMTNTTPKNIEKTPPKPLTTSDLQQKASSILHYSPKQTMSICQNLYEEGYITYMRTDSRYYSEEFINSAEKYIKSKYGNEYIKNDLISLSLNNKKQNDEKKTKKKKNDDNSQEAHEAIRPTKILIKSIEPSGKKITAKEVRMYKLIWNITTESCMSNSKYLKFLSTITSPIESKYKYSCEQITFPGWEVVQGYEEHNKDYHYLLKINTKRELSYNKIKGEYTLKEIKTHYNEAKLVSLLEKKGIGRPSTFSSIISKIEERGYVKKDDIKGIAIDCIDYELENDEISEIQHNKTLGGEKNKMVIQPIGKVVIEFLIKQYNKVFEYDYTKNMENELDKIAKGNKIWHSLCDECYKDIKSINDTIKVEETKQETELEGGYTFRIARYGPVLMKRIDGKIKYHKIKPDIDIEELKDGKIKPEDAILIEKVNSSLGKHKDIDVYLKKGKFGLYISYNDNNISLKGLKKEAEEITINDVLPYIENNNQSSKVTRMINENASIRNGKFGHYIYYKTNTMKKPKFIALKKYKIDYLNCDLEELENIINKHI